MGGVMQLIGPGSMEMVIVMEVQNQLQPADAAENMIRALTAD